jgi:alkylation response protein AidB-like acyl-CoA dehydrogenase
MSYLLNEEQHLLRESAISFLSEQSPVSLQRQLRDSAITTGYAQELWQQAVELGWTAAVLPESANGLAVGYMGLGAVFETMGRHLAALPLVSHTVLAGELLLRTGDAEQQAQWLPLVLSGEQRFALAMDESQNHCPASAQTQACQDDKGWTLNGEKWFVIDGIGARWLIVTAQVQGEPTPGLFVVDSNAPGVKVQQLHMADSRNHARISFTQVQLPSNARLESGSTMQALDAALDRARVCLASEALGIVRETFERTVGYLKERVQFDVVIGSFQALQHRVARLYTEIELLDSCVRGALAAIDADNAELPMLASLAKAKASDLCEKMLNEAIQLHGGIGVTDEFDLGLFVKRARIIQQSLGDALFHRDRYAQLKGF